MNLNAFQLERQMLDQMAATDRQARAAWMLQDRCPVGPNRPETRRRVIGNVLVTLGQLLENVGWAQHPHNAQGG